MLLIIYPKQINKLFLERFNKEKITFINKICNINKIKNKNNILLIDCDLLNDDGIIEEYNFCLEELFIVLKVEIILAKNINNKIIEIAKYYNCTIIEI